jgi:hypothetical protein
MGGIGLFSSSCHDPGYTRLPKNPDPRNFEIIRSYGANGWSVVMIRYPDCDNYEGKKICVYETPLTYVQQADVLDPHFSINGLSPFARFKPTEAGWKAAKKLIDKMK